MGRGTCLFVCWLLIFIFNSTFVFGLMVGWVGLLKIVDVKANVGLGFQHDSRALYSS